MSTCAIMFIMFWVLATVSLFVAMKYGGEG